MSSQEWDLTLSQIIDEVESNKLDWDDTIDDTILSQAADVMENECVVLDGLAQLAVSKTDDCTEFPELSTCTLTQVMKTYDVDMLSPSHGNFQLNSDVFEDRFEEIENEETKKRFASPTHDDDIKHLLKETESKNTRKNTKWSVGVFQQWRNHRQDDAIPDLKDFTAESVNVWFSKFVVEARKVDGSYYPPKTLYLIMTGLLRAMREQGNDINFLDVKRNDCYQFRRVLSAQMTKLTSQGFGTTTKQAEPLTEESEHSLWEKDVFGRNSAQSLLNTVFFYNCKLFRLRACDEHRQLEASQIVVGRDQQGSFIEFQGKTAKNYNGGLHHRSVLAKVLRHHTSSELPELYELYLTKIGRQGPFYRRPLAPRRGEDDLRYSAQVLGVNKLRSLMKDICSSGGIEGHFSNHSGKRTCATRLYEAGVEEQEIMRITGHRSVEAVRRYKRPSANMMADISNKLDPPKKVKFELSGAAVEKSIKIEDEATPQHQPTSHVTTNPNKSCQGNVIYQNCIFNY